MRTGRTKMGLGVCCMALLLAGCDNRRDDLARGLQYDWGTLREIPAALQIGIEVEAWSLDIDHPTGLAVTPQGYIVAVGARELVLLDDRGNPRRRTALPHPARCVTVDPDGQVLVGAVDRVLVFSADLERLSEWPALGARARITALAADDTQVYVADAGQRIVHRFSRAGERLGTLGGRGADGGAPGLIVPGECLDMALGAGGSLWVVNPGRRSLEEYRPDGSFVASWQPPATELEGFSGCCNPTHIALRADGSFVTSEKGLVRVKLYNPMGAFVGVLAGPSRFAEQEEGLALAALPDGRVLILVPSASQILVYRVRTDDRPREQPQDLNGLGVTQSGMLLPAGAPGTGPVGGGMVPERPARRRRAGV